MLMPSTPLAYPQVVSRRFAYWISAFTQFKSIYAPSSIPGSSPQKYLSPGGLASTTFRGVTGDPRGPADGVGSAWQASWL